ncbi:helix-turn-helix domain-containing protein [Brucella anthropi]|nr:helix-turn-helix domain-containing protein [Brucella anthropi]KAB2753898.1 helix-turn-helix domain-containing protein [Brucella anthropi]KAB2784077.1 helix-turn-helix domain-containing protein [Brucella anthropi]
MIPSRLLPRYIGISAQTLARWRHEGKGPVFVKIGRLVAYRVSDIRQWLIGHQRSNTTQ